MGGKVLGMWCGIGALALVACKGDDKRKEAPEPAPAPAVTAPVFDAAPPPPPPPPDAAAPDIEIPVLQ